MKRAAPTPFRNRQNPPSGRFREVVLDLLALGYGVRFRASGRSMHPTVNEGEMITVEPVEPSAIRKGDIILYRFTKGFVAHRVVRIERGANSKLVFILQGDASTTCDAPVREEQVLGRVVFAEREGRRIDLAARRARLFHAIRGKARRVKGWVYGGGFHVGDAAGSGKDSPAVPTR